MKLSTLAPAYGLSILLSCGDASKQKAESSAISNDSSTEVQQSEDDGTIEAGASETIQMEAPSDPVIVNPAPSQPTAAGMNPPHGEPGHRCDIAVGAPLNSAPSAPPSVNMAPQNQSMPVTTMPQMTADPSSSGQTVTAPGMNPPHGQPGHDCSIAVGAPLKK